MRQKGELFAKEPQHLYPVVTAIKGEQSVTAVYSADRIVSLASKCSIHTVINGTKQRTLTIKSPERGSCHVLVRDCLGEALQEWDMEWRQGLVEFPVTASGLIELSLRQMT